jgi:hypothetical protein
MKSPSSMRNGRFHTSKCRGKLQKMEVLYIHSPKMLAHPHGTKKYIQKNSKIAKNRGQLVVCQTAGCGRLATSRRPPTVAGCPKLTLSSKFFFILPSLWSTLVGWLQHMPALPRLLLKTSNTHTFLSVGPKIMKFVLTQSLWQDASSQKVSKNLKIK